MGKAIIRVTPELIIGHMLRLQGYELTQTRVEALVSGRDTLVFEVESPDLPDEPTERQITPVYESMTDEQGRYWYRLVRIEGAEP